MVLMVNPYLRNNSLQVLNCRRHTECTNLMVDRLLHPLLRLCLQIR